MKKIFILSFVLLFAVLNTANSQITSGIVMGVSNSNLGASTHYSYNSSSGESIPEKWEPQFKLNIGYQFRFELPYNNDFLFDTAILGQVTKAKVASSLATDNAWLAGLSVNGVVGYRVWKGLRAGIGIEPTVYFDTNKLANNIHSNVFDCPLLIKAGYELNRCELSLTYKHGWSRLYESPAITAVDGARDFQLSLFVPLFK